MKRKGCHVIFGPPGAGKSVEAARTFQNSLYIASSPTILAYYRTWMRTPEGQAEKAALPKKQYIIDPYSVTILDQDEKEIYFESNLVDGMPQRINGLQHIEHAINSVVKACHAAKAAGQPPPYDHVVLDELRALWLLAFHEILPNSFNDKGKLDTRMAYGTLAKWSVDIIAKLRSILSVGVGIGIVTHEQEPDGDKKGGPSVVGQAAGKDLHQAADTIIMRTIEDAPLDMKGLLGDEVPKDGTVTVGARRVWVAKASTKWATKIRGISDERFDEIKTWTLRQILEAGDWAL